MNGGSCRSDGGERGSEEAASKFGEPLEQHGGATTHIALFKTTQKLANVGRRCDCKLDKRRATCTRKGANQCRLSRAARPHQ